MFFFNSGAFAIPVEGVSLALVEFLFDITAALIQFPILISVFWRTDLAPFLIPILWSVAFDLCFVESTKFSGSGKNNFILLFWAVV